VWGEKELSLYEIDYCFLFRIPADWQGAETQNGEIVFAKP
jgi:hypothetical protein